MGGSPRARRLRLAGLAALALSLGAIAYHHWRRTLAREVVADARITYGYDGPADARGVPAPWQWKLSAGKAEVAVKARPEEPGALDLWFRGRQASFFLARTDREFGVAEYPTVAWCWKAVTLPTGGDVRKSSLLPFADNRNDQVLQLLVTFDTKEVISYLWDSTAPVGTEVKEQNPFASIMAVVVESGGERLGQWRSYRRDLRDDYRRLFKGRARSVIGIAVQSNANHTRSESEGYFGPVEFIRAPSRGKDDDAH